MSEKSEAIEPRDHAEAIAVFRAQILGPVLCRTVDRGALAVALRTLSAQAFRPPGASVTRRYSVPTLERWVYRYRAEGIKGLRPQSRSSGFALDLTDQQRALLLDIRRERPNVPVSVLLRTLQADGRLAKGAVSSPTVRRLFAAHGLDAASMRQNDPSENGRGHIRMRWEAERPGILWHADVCHGPGLRIQNRNSPLRVHAILDDASRYIVAIQAFHTEREVDMLTLMVKALRTHAAPEMLYLDNGSTYSGEALATACARMGISLLHARPYDPQARGKMERFWRTLREGCLNHVGSLTSLHDVQVRLMAFLSEHYHRSEHGALLGKSPAEVWQASAHASTTAERPCMTEEQMRDALIVRNQRRVKHDGTLAVGGVDWEVTQSFLAGRMVTVARTLLMPNDPPWIEHDGKTYTLHRVNPKANGKLKRHHDADSPAGTMRGVDAIPFDPAGALLDRAVGRPPSHASQRSTPVTSAKQRGVS